MSKNCAQPGASDGLIREIERVIYEAHTEEQREGSMNFAELLESKTTRFRQSRDREAEAIASISERIAEELEKEGSVAALTTQSAQKKGQVDGYKTNLGKLVLKGTQAQATRHAELSQAAQLLTANIQTLKNKRRTYLTMQNEAKNLSATKTPEMLREAKTRHPLSGLSPIQWDDFCSITRGMWIRP